MLSLSKKQQLLNLTLTEPFRKILSDAINGWEESNPHRQFFGIEYDFNPVNNCKFLKTPCSINTCLIGAANLNNVALSKCIDSHTCEKYDISIDTYWGIIEGFDFLGIKRKYSKYVDIKTEDYNNGFDFGKTVADIIFSNYSDLEDV